MSANFAILLVVYFKLLLLSSIPALSRRGLRRFGGAPRHE
jgi:hypothetical protein